MMKVILCTNNKYEDPFLHSQLLYIYDNIDLVSKKILFCRYKGDQPPEDVINIAYGKFSFLIYFFKLFFLLLTIDKKQSLFHIRGYVSAFLFYFATKVIFWKRIKYIYDPRGAFITELKESRFNNEDNLLLKFLHYIEQNIIKSSVKTIVTTIRFKELYVDEFGYEDKYIVLYNTSALPSEEKVGENILEKEEVNICYIGSLDFWHDLDEIIRVISYTQNQISQASNVHFFTNYNDKDLIKKKLKDTGVDNFNVEFVPYSKVKEKLMNMDICISVVVPTMSQVIASPIKISDYIQLNKIIITNEDIGDFDSYFKENNSVLLYEYGSELSYSLENLIHLDINANSVLKEKLSLETNRIQIEQIIKES